MAMKVEERLSQKKKAVERELASILSQGNSLLFQAMRHAVLSGGKRFRPILALSSGECFGASPDLVLPFACALELIHNYSLVHDDLPSIDNDDFRRGKPSCHKAYGEDIALLAGDSLLTMAFEILARAPLGESLQSKRERIIMEISQSAGVKGMVGGQFMDITLSQDKLTEETYQELILKKTGSLIIASVKTGATLGEAGASELEAAVKYGRNVGLAFQIRDDILDSGQDGQKGRLPRPNYVSMFGIKDSERKLKDFVEAARNALDEASLKSEELHYLATKLLELEKRSENEQNS
jgi:geranylgeranyl diphosphate synthase type II